MSSVCLARAPVGVFGELSDLIAPMFARAEPRRQAIQYISGLLSGPDRANSWQIARATGDELPWRTQRLLNRARWNADAVRRAVRGHLACHLGHRDGVLVLDETSVVKKGTKSVGVERQYAEITRQVANCQTAVVAAYVSPLGRSLVDHELFLPGSWVADADRCRQAGVPDDRIRLRSKAELATDMIGRVARDLPVGWIVAGGEMARDPHLRAWLAGNPVRSLLEIPAGQSFPISEGGLIAAGELTSRLPDRAWRAPLGGREQWARIGIRQANGGFVNSLLARRRPGQANTVYFAGRAPEGTSLAEMAAAANARSDAAGWVNLAQDEIGMNCYEVRTWQAYYRHVTLAMVALVALATGRP